MTTERADDDPALSEAIEQQRSMLRTELINEFASYQSFRDLAEHPTVMNLRLEAGIGGQTITTVQVADTLIEHCCEQGHLPALLRRAIELRPANRTLLRIAESVGLGQVRRSVRAVEAALDSANFDLEELELRCRRSINSNLERRLFIVVLVGAAPETFDALAERLKPVLQNGGLPPHVKEMTVDAISTQFESYLHRLESACAKVEQRPVLVRLLCGRDSQTMLERLLSAASSKLPGPLKFHCVLLVSAAQPLAEALPCLPLPAPLFEDAHLFDWVATASAGQGWADDLVTALKRWLAARARYKGKIEPSLVYDALQEAAELLRENLDEAALKQRLGLQ